MATAYGSLGFSLSCLHASVSPTSGVQIRITVHVKASDARIHLVRRHIKNHVISTNSKALPPI